VATNKAGQIVSVLPAPDGGWSTYSSRHCTLTTKL
jgi:hypothetical protein